MNLTKSIQVLFPSAVPGQDFVVSKPVDGPAVISSWTLDAPQPSTEALEAAWEEVQELEALRSGLLSAWESAFTLGERALLSPVFNEAVRLFDSGDVAGAKSVISTIPSDLSATLATKRATVLALFP